MGAHQACPSLGFSRQEHWSGLPFPSPVHESGKWKWSCSFVSISATPWTAAYQASPSMGFSRQKYWSGMSLPSLLASSGDTKVTFSIPGSERPFGVGNGNPVQYSCLENPMDRGAWQATVCGVANSWTWLSNWAHIHIFTDTVTVPVYIPTNSVEMSLFSTAFQHSLFADCLMMVILTGVQWYLIVVITWISLILNKGFPGGSDGEEFACNLEELEYFFQVPLDNLYSFLGKMPL